MSQVAVVLETNTIEVAKQSAARLGRVIVQMPASKSITESTHLSGAFDTFNDAGIPVPNGAPVLSDGGAGVMSGDRAVYVVFRDSNRDSIGNPSAISNTLTISSRDIDIDLTNITNEAANSRVTHIDIYVNLSTGGSIYYFAATVTAATTSTTINVSDATLQANDTLETDNDAPTAETYGAVVEHKARVFMVGAHAPANPAGSRATASTTYEDDYIWSKANNADQYPLLNRTKVQPGAYGRLMVAVPCGDALIFYKERCISELHFDQDPSGVFGDGYAKVVNTHRGTVNSRTVANVQGQHFVMDRLGIYHFAGGTAYRELATRLRHYWNRINWSRAGWFCAAVDLNAVYFTVALDGEDECKWMFVLDLDAWYARGDVNWYIYKTDHGIRDLVAWTIGGGAAAVDTGLSYTPVVAVLTEYGYTGFMQAGYRDFVDSQLTASGTATGGTTTTLVDSGATFSRTNDAGSTVSVIGAYLRIIHPNADKPGSADWSGPYRITGVSGTTLTFTPAAPASVASGMSYVIGAIPDAVLHSPQYGFDMPHHSKRAASTILEFQPGGIEYTVGVQIAMDRRAPQLTRLTTETAQTVTTDRYQGVQMKVGGALSDGGRVGVHATGSGGHGFRYMQIILTGNVAGGHALDCPAVIDAVLIDGLVTEIAGAP